MICKRCGRPFVLGSGDMCSPCAFETGPRLQWTLLPVTVIRNLEEMEAVFGPLVVDIAHAAYRMGTKVGSA